MGQFLRALRSSSNGFTNSGCGRHAGARAVRGSTPLGAGHSFTLRAPFTGVRFFALRLRSRFGIRARDLWAGGCMFRHECDKSVEVGFIGYGLWAV